MNEWLAGSESSYLLLARRILRSVRRPLTPREIMAAAYKDGLVPSHLHGRTQHKTLQARLSEDILRERERSLFFRTAPGKFFLREFIDDDRLPTQFRTPIVARRRVRDLPKKGALALNRGAVEIRPNERDITYAEFKDWIRANQYRYIENVKERDPDDIFVWTFVVVAKGSMILSYRHGQYREGRDSFLHKRCVGFYNLVTGDDLTLFDQDDHGVLSSGLKAISMDLDLPIEGLDETGRVSRAGFIYNSSNNSRDLLGLIKYECPEWFEPLGRRLSLNDLTWIDATHSPNNIEDYDPWSQDVLVHLRSIFSAA